MESVMHCGYPLIVRSFLTVSVSLLKSSDSTNDFGSVDQTVDNSSLNVLEVAGFEMKISSCMNRFPVHVCG
jgi:hypothetical protein